MNVKLPQELSLEGMEPQSNNPSDVKSPGDIEDDEDDDDDCYYYYYHHHYHYYY